VDELIGLALPGGEMEHSGIMWQKGYLESWKRREITMSSSDLAEDHPERVETISNMSHDCCGKRRRFAGRTSSITHDSSENSPVFLQNFRQNSLFLFETCCGR
jgi:hypothetical protein